MADKGAKYERQLRDFFYDQDGVGIRIPTSGAGTPHELPDVLGKIDGQPYACELKYTSKEKVRFDKQEINELLFFSNLWGAKPVLVARFAYDKTFWAFPYKDMRNFKQWKDYKSVSFKKDEKEEYLTDLADVVQKEHGLEDDH